MGEPIRLSISEAARLFGIDPQTIRRAIKQQEISYVVTRNRYQLNFESVLRWSQHRPTTKNKLKKRGLGQFVEKWKIKNVLFSPNPQNFTPPPASLGEALRAGPPPIPSPFPPDLKPIDKKT